MYLHKIGCDLKKNCQPVTILIIKIKRLCRYNLKKKQITWEKDGKKLLHTSEDFSLSYDGERCVLTIKRVYPEDEGEYRCIASNNIGKTVSSACIIVDGMLNRISFLFSFFYFIKKLNNYYLIFVKKISPINCITN